MQLLLETLTNTHTEHIILSEDGRLKSDIAILNAR